MTGFAGLIATANGITIITDSSVDGNRTTGTYKINDNVIAIIFYGLNRGLEFCNKFLKDSKGNVHDIFKKSTDSLNLHKKEYQDEPFSIILCSYFQGLPAYLGVWLDDQKDPKGGPLPETTYFSQEHEDISKYLISKVYSQHMSLEESINLMSYVTLQCMRIFPIGYKFEITTISNKGIKTFTDGEMNDAFQKMEKLDNKLKKIFSDFFISENKIT